MSPFIASCTRQGMHGFWPLDPARRAGRLGTPEFFDPGSSHCIAPSTGAPLWCMGADWPHGYLAAMAGAGSGAKRRGGNPDERQQQFRMRTNEFRN